LIYSALLTISINCCSGKSEPVTSSEAKPGKPVQAAELKFKSGQYEQLMLAIDSQGNLTGYYHEDQGQGISKRCEFYLSGKGFGGEIPVLTWSNRTLPGTLTALSGSVKLRIEKGRDHAGCGQVLLPQINQGLKFDLTEDAAWSELRQISSDRSNFYMEPDAAKALKTFVVRGDIVGIIVRNGEWLLTEYHGAKSTTKGWLVADTTSKLSSPAR
jgi:hypothetical protein